MTQQQLAASIHALADRVRAVNQQIEAARREIDAKRPRPRGLTDFRIPPHMRYRLRRIVGRP